MRHGRAWANRFWQWGATGHALAVVGLVVWAAVGIRLEGVGGWVACPPQVIEIGGQPQFKRERRSVHQEFAWQAGWAWLKRSWLVTAVRSEAVWLLVVWQEWWAWEWLILLPWVLWLWQGLGVAWPRLRQQGWYRGLRRLMEETGRLALIGLGLVWLGQAVIVAGAWLMEQSGGHEGPMLSSLAVMPMVRVEQDEEGVYQVQLKGEFELQVNGQVMFYKRMLIIFLSLLKVEGESRGSRRTRDGQTPFVRQQQLAEWFGVPQPNISRWRGYWLKQDWRRLLSQQAQEVLTLEVQQRIMESWAKFPWWGAERFWEHLRQQGERITLDQVQQAGRASGWTMLRQNLKQIYAISVESFRPRDEWLVEQLLAQGQKLVEQLEAKGGLTPAQQVALADLEAMSQELGLSAPPKRAPWPWVMQMEHILFGYWQPVEDDSVCCCYCGSQEVSRKSRTPRLKKYIDDQDQVQTVAVYRYYCHNPECPYQSFTNLPPNLLPYSPWSVSHRLAALQMYEWSRSVYRRSGQALGVSKMTAYRWVSGFGYELLPIAALFGVVRSSGVMGVDEKYVLVPKNDKPESKMKRWMYVYFAVDCYTYDLLHLDIYPYNNSHSARAFLLALRAKGYRPRVIVTDMRVDYGSLIAQVFPKAIHHECIFHALQQVSQHFKEIYGSDYAETQPEVETLRQEICHIFEARTKRTAQRRYQAVLAQQEQFVAKNAEAIVVFDFLERHWLKLVNAIESHHIPTTNNTTEQVIRIFTQHYKTFCGFENIDSARCYLAVFEKVYRFTPFSDDAQERIRGKCPLELAGYQVDKLPMAQICRGWALQWPASAFQELVPNV
jgi:transposase-like protein